MSSICVKEESGSRLHISIEPTGTTWAVIFGIFSLIIGCPLYNFDCACLVLLVWILGTAALLAAFSPWQEVIIDKELQSVVCSRQNFFQRYILQAFTPVTIDLGNIESVQRDGSAFLFELRNRKTVQLNVKLDTQKLDQLVEKIRNFLQHEYTQTKLITPSSESEAASRNLEGAANEDSSSATSDDSFERIDSADLADYDHAKTEVDNDIPSESILSLSPSTEELKDLPLESSEEQLPPASESTPPSSRVDQQTSESVDGPAAPSDVGLNP